MFRITIPKFLTATRRRRFPGAAAPGTGSTTRTTSSDRSTRRARTRRLKSEHRTCWGVPKCWRATEAERAECPFAPAEALRSSTAQLGAGMQFRN